jgi:8-oxo-dGTP diphosphatase
MAQERFKVIPASFVILEKEGQVLLMRRFNTGYADGWYDAPAGHIEEGEFPSITAQRELKEELGISVDLKDLLAINTVYNISDPNTYMYIFFAVTVWDGEPRLMEKNKCDDVSWFSKDELPENILPYVKDSIALYFFGSDKKLLEYSLE